MGTRLRAALCGSAAALALLASPARAGDHAAAVEELSKWATPPGRLIDLLDSCPKHADESLLAAQTRCLRHRVRAVRIAAADALGRSRMRGSVAPLIAALRSERTVTAQSAIARALYSLTGANLGEAPAAWRRWWKRHGETFAVPARPPGQKKAKPKKEADARRTVATFYGLPVRSDRIVFVIDRSLSMAERMDETRNRLDVAIEEVIGAIAKLPSTVKVNLIFFGTDVWTWKKQLVPLSSRTRKALKIGLKSVRPRGGTSLWPAIEAALKDPDVEEVFLLTDGEPSSGRFVKPSQILTNTRRLNRHRRAVFHCVSIGRKSFLLNELAAMSGGRVIRR